MDLVETRSLIFLPGDRTDRLNKAAALSSGGVILDLEDGVTPGALDAARAALANGILRLRAMGRNVVVRINNGEALALDLEAMSAAWPDAVMLPKAETAEMVLGLRRALTAKAAPRDMRLILLVETPLGVLDSGQVAAAAQAEDALAFGSEDFAMLMDIAPSAEELDFAARQVALAARAYGLAAFGVIGSIGEIKDQDAFARYCNAARRAGFTGALTIHPAQVATAERIFAPTTTELAWAKAVIEDAAKGGEGATLGRDGRMIDRPVLSRARSIVRRAGE
jgi:citrate lyase subunit beta/citryl-CoA lyase